MISESIVKRSFLNDTLYSYAKHAENSQKLRMSQFLNRRTGAMLNTVSSKVISYDDDQGSITFNIALHQRFQDMRLRSKVYNRIFSWYYFKIAERLQYGYTEEIKAMIISKLSDKE